MAVAGGMDRVAGIVSEGGRGWEDGQREVERKSSKLPGMEFGSRVLWKRRRQGGPLGKLSCMWEDGIYLVVNGTTGEMIVGDRKGV